MAQPISIRGLILLTAIALAGSAIGQNSAANGAPSIADYWIGFAGVLFGSLLSLAWLSIKYFIELPWIVWVIIPLLVTIAWFWATGFGETILTIFYWIVVVGSVIISLVILWLLQEEFGFRAPLLWIIVPSSILAAWLWGSAYGWVLLLIVSGCIGVGILNVYRKLKLEKEQKARGLVKFIDRHGNVMWGTPKQVFEWRSKEEEELRTEEEEARVRAEKERPIKRVVAEIENFSPAREYGHEFPYQAELVGWLKSKFPDAEIELQKGSSRPDIVVNSSIAIEVKGPTTHEALRTVADKCMRYSQHFEGLIVVLFAMKVPEGFYDEWEEGIRRYFPNVVVIKKD